MKLSEHWKSYVDYTTDLSSAARTAGFAGVAICWILAGESFHFKGPVLFALALLVLFLTLDLLQLFGSALLYRFWLRSVERRLSRERALSDQSVEKPGWLDVPAFSLFVTKISTLLAGFALLGVEVWLRITAPHAG